jgi:hypothetical protein
MNKSLGFAACQFSVSGSMDANLQYILRYTRRASQEGAATSLDDLILAQLRTRAADNRMWISASNSSARHSRLAA